MEETGQAPQNNPLDTSPQEAELKSLVQELTQAQETLESDFASFVAESITPEEEELFFEDKTAFIKMVLEKQNAFYEERIRSKEKRAKELESDIANKKNLGIIEEAEKRFLAEYKISDEEFQKIMDFVTNDVPPRVQKELERLEPYDFFKESKRLYDEANGATKADKKEKAQLPTRLDGTAGSAEFGGDESPMSRI